MANYLPFDKIVLLLKGLTFRIGAGAGKVLTSDAYGNASWQTMGAPSVNWGDIGGTLSDQTDLQAALDALELPDQTNNGGGFLQTDGSSASWKDIYGLSPIISDTDVLAFLSATGITDPVQMQAVNYLVVKLKAASLWTPFVGIYPMVGGTATTHKYNLKTATAGTFNGGWTHSITGARPNGTTGYFQTGIIPGTHLSNTSSTLAYYSRTISLTNNNFWDMGAGNGTTGANSNTLFLKRLSTNNCGFDSGNGAANGRVSSTLVPTSRGFFVGVCEGATSRKIYYNGSLVNVNTASDTTAASTFEIYIGALNNLGTAFGFCDRECAGAFIGAKITADEEAVLRNIVEVYNYILGRNN